ncbi:hypothetical protein ACP70R_002428 [Stipagrostis hirtigluma subsp. patula]
MKHEAVALLQAVVSSKTALTDAFVRRLQGERLVSSSKPLPRFNGEDFTSMEKMQIFIKALGSWSGTIILEVASSDTILTVWSNIQRKLPHVNPSTSRLDYCGKYLKDSRMLADYYTRLSRALRRAGSRRARSSVPLRYTRAMHFLHAIFFSRNTFYMDKDHACSLGALWTRKT